MEKDTPVTAWRKRNRYLARHRSQKSAARTFLVHAPREMLIAMKQILEKSGDTNALSDSISDTDISTIDLPCKASTFQTYRYEAMSFISDAASEEELAEYKIWVDLRLAGKSIPRKKPGRKPKN